MNRAQARFSGAPPREGEGVTRAAECIKGDYEGIQLRAWKSIQGEYKYIKVIR